MTRIGAAIFVFLSIVSATARADTLRVSTTIKFDIAADLSVTRTQTVEKTPLIPETIPNAALLMTAIAGSEKLEIIEAYTRKADGRIIIAPPAATTHGTPAGDKFSRNEIKFSDVSVGDTTVTTMRITKAEHYVAGNYSEFIIYMPDGVQTEYDITAVAPSSLYLRHSENEFSYEQSDSGNLTTRRWRGTFQRKPTPQESSIDAGSSLPNIYFSTLKSYEDLGNAWFAGYGSKIQVTPEVQRLAELITQGKTEPRSLAEAIFDWVSTNIHFSYANLGSGHLNPPSVDEILARRSGDCKDMATLMTALLKAKGVESELVLVPGPWNVELPETPVFQTFSHAIVYIPSLDAYADPTVPTSAFGALPSFDLDRPVLRLSARGVTIARTPAETTSTNFARVETLISTSPSGALQGETVVEARGALAQILREFVHLADVGGQDVVLGAVGEALRITGRYKMSVPAWNSHAEPYVIRTSWSAENTPMFSYGGWLPSEPFSPILARHHYFLGKGGPEKRIYPSPCLPGRIVQDVRVKLPEDATPILPAPLASDMPGLSYAKRWSFENHTLSAHTEIALSVKDHVCGPEFMNAAIPAMIEIQRREAAAKVYFKQPE